MLPIGIVSWNLRALGLDFATVATVAGIDTQPGATITYAESVRLWQATESLLEDATVGHRSGVHIRLHELGALGGILGHAPDLRTGLTRLVAVLPPMLPGVLQLQEVAGGARVTYQRPSAELLSRHGVESLMGSLVSLSRHCLRQNFTPRSVGLANPPPPAGPEVYDAFYGVTVIWNTQDSFVEFDDATLSQPMTGADPDLSALLLEHANDLLGTLGTAEVERRVTRALLSALEAGDPSLHGVARALGIGPRTLQRQLDAARISFRAVRTAVLRDRATWLLLRPTLSVEQVADLLGYQSRTAFDRAFRSWTGLTPASFRKSRSR